MRVAYCRYFVTATVQLSLLDAFNEQYIQGGDLACGAEPPQFSESDSSGKFKIKDEELEPLCFVTKRDIDGMCGDMVQLSGSDGTFLLFTLLFVSRGISISTVLP